jgi:A/G-specific adenine glycosylase
MQASSSPGERSPDRLRRLRTALLRWYRKNGRELSWRSTRDPYAIWVSEIMLQQTRVATVGPYYRRFLERFPDVRALAEAPEETVLGVWSGLGYYRRARSLLAAARSVVERHGGRLPDDVAGLRSLPGIGRYTAGAIASIAFGKEEPVLDGNVRRVLCRLTADPGDNDKTLWAIAGHLVRGPAPGDLNQALMELGATVCTPRAPGCDACPLRAGCRALREGDVERFPRGRAAPATETVRVAVAVIVRGERVLLERPGNSSPFRGTWDLPGFEIGPAVDPRRAIGCEARRRHALHLRVNDSLGRASHSILHRRLRLESFECRLSRGRPSENPDLRWVHSGEIADVATSGATRKILRLR